MSTAVRPAHDPSVAPAPSRTATRQRRPKTSVLMFVAAVTTLGGVMMAAAVGETQHAILAPGLVFLTICTIASSRYRIKVPGHSASVSVSEVFVFASVLLYGPGPATLVVALDGCLIALGQKDRRLYRALFNIAEPAVSTFCAAHAFFLGLALPTGLPTDGPSSLIVPTVLMAATYFLANSTLTAVAVGLESGQQVGAIWRSHALYSAMNYYAAASVAVLVFKSEAGVNVGVVGLVAPLLALSYAAYKAAASRVVDADRHLKEIESLYQATVETLAIAVDAKDQVTHGHIRRVQRHTVAVARALGVSDPLELRALEAASLLHDVGKLAVPDYVLNKPGALSHGEFERMKQHAAKGAEILSAVEFPYAVVPVVRHHHEQWNGKGYPDGLAGEDIPFGARILAVVDCFDAVTSDRPYRRKMTDEQGIDILLARRGTMYDPKIVEAFVTLIPALRREDRTFTPHHDESPSNTAPVEATPTRINPPVERQTDPEIGQVLQRSLTEWLEGAEACYFAPHANSGRLTATCFTERLREVVSGLEIAIGEGLAGWVAVNRHTIVNSHADLDLEAAAEALGLEACTGTPVFALGDLVGVVSVYFPAGRKFTEREVHAVGALAQEIGMVVASRKFAADGPSLGRGFKGLDRLAS